MRFPAYTYPVVALTAFAGMSAQADPIAIEEGMFFTPGKYTASDFTASDYPGVGPHGSYAVGQMFVHYRKPANNPDAVPIIMAHGSRHTGALFEMTPDGREGWSTLFVRKNYSTYVVDLPGNGRSNFNAEPINIAVAKKSVENLPAFGVSTREHAWVGIRMGAKFGTPYPDTQFPIPVHDDYLMQKVPNTLAAMPDDAWSSALATLSQRLKKAVLITNSRSGGDGWIVGQQHPETLHAIVAIEPQTCNVTDAGLEKFVNVPVLIIFGDHFTGTTWAEPVAVCRQFVSRLKARGANATITVLPEIGIKGNTHVMMMDRNSHEIANRIDSWLKENVKL